MEDTLPPVIIPATRNNKKNQAITNNVPPNKKSRRVMNFLKLALYMLRRKSGAKPTANMGLWRKLLGSMRPLHLQSNDQSPPPPLSHAIIPPPDVVVEHSEEAFMPPPTISPVIIPPPDKVVEHIIEEAFPPPLSPALHSSSSSVDGGMSQYASAVNLQELDRCDEDEEVYTDSLGDVMIDAKAEEFIANFYEQMMLQDMERTNRTNWSLR